MPTHLLIDAVAPVAASLADVAGTEGSLGDQLHAHHVATTSFLHLPIPRRRIFDMLVGPEIQAYHWLQGKVNGIWHKMIDPAYVTPDQARMVEYYAASCPHCQHLQPIWKSATEQWAGNADADRVVWQEKECFDGNWKPGKDYEECQTQHVYGFPTVKFFPPGSKTGDTYFFDRTADKLVDFAKTGISPEPMTISRAEGDVSEMKLVDFYAAGCPHCKKLDPVWTEATKQWEAGPGQSEDAPLVSFEKKECYDSQWHPGKDYAECQKFKVKGFPSIKLFAPSETGHGFAAEADYHGKRTPEAINEFLRKESELEEPSPVGAGHEEHGAGTPSDAKALSAGLAQHAAQDHAAQPMVKEEGREEPPSAVAAPSRAVAPRVQEPVAEAKPPTELIPQAPRADMPEALAQAVKTAAMPLPMVMSCLPARRQPCRRSVAQRPPREPAQFL